jgi:hypothetical protein
VKLLYCGLCGDIRTPDPNGEVTYCRCGNTGARWEDPKRGIFKMRARDRRYARVIGIHNGLLEIGMDVLRLSDSDWRTAHEFAVRSADGYVFHESRRACWVAVLAPGQSADTSFEPFAPEPLPEDRPGSAPLGGPPL